jgi:hypothetical protein
MNIPGLSSESVYFPERRNITKTAAHLEPIIEQAKKINLDKVKFDGEDFQPHSKVIQKQKVYFWIRVYLKEEIDILPETKVDMVYLDGVEKIETIFIYFGKKGLERDQDGQIVNFNPEDDKRVLCLMVDSDRVDVNNSDIPYMKTIFKLGKYFKPDYMKLSEFTFVIDGDKQVEFFDIDF